MRRGFRIGWISGATTASMIGRFGSGWRGSISSGWSVVVGRSQASASGMERMPCDGGGSAWGVGVLRLRECCASHSAHSAQDDTNLGVPKKQEIVVAKKIGILFGMENT